MPTAAPLNGNRTLAGWERFTFLHGGIIHAVSALGNGKCYLVRCFSDQPFLFNRAPWCAGYSLSQDFRKYKLNAIPRYMIFDKTGNLIHANAPRVESSEIGLLLTRLADKP